MRRVNGYETYGKKDKTGPTRSELAKERLQKAGSWISKKAGEAKEQYKAYKAAEPERRKERIEKYKSQYEEAKWKNKLKKERPAAYTFGGFAGPTRAAPVASVGVAEYLGGGSQRAPKRATGPSLGNMLGGGQKRKGRNISKELRGFGL